MIISLKPEADRAAVLRELAARGLWVSQAEHDRQGGVARLVIAPHSCAIDAAEVARIEGIADVATPASGHPRVDRQGPAVDVSGVRIGGGALPALMCGPCSVESEAQIDHLAELLAPHGVRFLRGGAFKPRTSPYAFQGYGEAALRWMRRAADRYEMKVVTEALSEAEAPIVAEYADLVQVGSRNMHNYALLKAIGHTKRPVLLKRAMAATLEEWLLSAEYLLVYGAPGVVLCERGIRSFDGSTRNLLDVGAIALLARVHGVPVVADPSHAAGRRDLVAPLGRAALAAGAAGLMIETHEDPGRALSDGPQAMLPRDLGPLLDAALGRGGAS
jgi:3-deoxy-7-phosphoheptulonate synthase